MEVIGLEDQPASNHQCNNGCEHNNTNHKKKERSAIAAAKFDKNSLAHLKTIQPSSRMGYVQVILTAYGHIGRLMQGWGQWFAAPHIMAAFTDEDLKEFAEAWKQLAIAILELELKSNDICAARIKEELKKMPPPPGFAPEQTQGTPAPQKGKPSAQYG